MGKRVKSPAQLWFHNITAAVNTNLLCICFRSCKSFDTWALLDTVCVNNVTGFRMMPSTPVEIITSCSMSKSSANSLSSEEFHGKAAVKYKRKIKISHYSCCFRNSHHHRAKYTTSKLSTVCFLRVRPTRSSLWQTVPGKWAEGFRRYKLQVCVCV